MRRAFQSRPGFTLVEVMITSAIGLVVLTAVVSSFLTTQRMLKAAMVETELSLATRELREKILFRVSPTISGKTYSGLFGALAEEHRPNGQTVSTRRSFENQVRQGYVEQLYAPAVGTTLTSLSFESMRLTGFRKDSTPLLVNEHTPDRDRHLAWLWPGRFAFDGLEKKTWLKYAAISPNDANNPMIYRLYIDLNLKSGVRNADGTEIVRKERVAVPLLGRLQQLQDVNTDGKTTY